MEYYASSLQIRISDKTLGDNAVDAFRRRSRGVTTTFTYLPVQPGDLNFFAIDWNEPGKEISRSVVASALMIL
jgi:hypothetical protein